MNARSVTVRAHGHPVLRGTHAKTFELTAEPEVGARATCVLGVAAEIPAELALLRGEVRLTLTVDHRSTSGVATINPDHHVGERLVIRRSDSADADTFALRSSLTAADLPVDFTSALRSTAATLTLTVTESVPPAPLVIVGQAGSAPEGRLSVLEQGAEPVTLSRPPADWAGRVFAAARSEAAGWTAATAGDWLAAAARNRARFVVDGVVDDPMAVMFAAGLPAAPVLWLGHLGRAAVRARGTRTALVESTVPVATVVAAAYAQEVLDLLAAADPDRRVATPDGVIDVGIGLQWTTAGAAREHAPNRDMPLVIAPVGDPGSVNVAALLQALAGAGVPNRTIAEALRPLGWDRRTLYRLLAERTEAG